MSDLARTIGNHLPLLTVLLPIVGTVLAYLASRIDDRTAWRIAVTNAALTTGLGFLLFARLDAAPEENTGRTPWQMMTIFSWATPTEAIAPSSGGQPRGAAVSQNYAGVLFATGTTGVTGAAPLTISLACLVALFLLGNGFQNGEAGGDRLGLRSVQLTALHASSLLCVVAADGVTLLIGLALLTLIASRTLAGRGTADRGRRSKKFLLWGWAGWLCFAMSLAFTAAAQIGMCRIAGINPLPTGFLPILPDRIGTLAVTDPDAAFFWREFSIFAVPPLFAGLVLFFGLFPVHSPRIKSESATTTDFAVLVVTGQLVLALTMTATWVLPILPSVFPRGIESPSATLTIIRTLLLCGLVVGSLASVAERDVRRQLATIAGVGLQIGLLSVLTLTPDGITGGLALLQFFALLMPIGYLFVGGLENRYRTRDPLAMNGLVHRYPGLIGLGVLFGLGWFLVPAIGDTIGLTRTVGAVLADSESSGLLVLAALFLVGWGWTRSLVGYALGPFREPTFDQRLLPPAVGSDGTSMQSAVKENRDGEGEDSLETDEAPRTLSLPVTGSITPHEITVWEIGLASLILLWGALLFGTEAAEARQRFSLETLVRPWTVIDSGTAEASVP